MNGCHKYDTMTLYGTEKEARKHAKTYEQYGRFRIVRDRRTGNWKCFAYEWGQHPYSK